MERQQKPASESLRQNYSGVTTRREARGSVIDDRRPASKSHAKMREMIDTSPRIVAQQKVISGPRATAASSNAVVQGVFEVGAQTYNTKKGKRTNALIQTLRSDARANRLKRGWVLHLRGLAREAHDHGNFASTDDVISYLETKFKKTPRGKLKRPTFSAEAYRLAKATESVKRGEDMSDISLSDNNLAVLHRMPFADIRRNLLRFVKKEETAADLIRWTDRLVVATRLRATANILNDSEELLFSDYAKTVEDQIKKFQAERARIIKVWAKPNGASQTEGEVELLLGMLNNMHGNIPDLGRHNGLNIQVSNRGHPHFYKNGSMSPGTAALFAMSPDRFERGIAVTKDEKHYATTDGMRVPVAAAATAHKLSATTISSSTLLTPNRGTSSSTSSRAPDDDTDEDSSSSAGLQTTDDEDDDDSGTDTVAGSDSKRMANDPDTDSDSGSGSDSKRPADDSDTDSDAGSDSKRPVRSGPKGTKKDK
ncbi:hypothetical protein [Pandoraea pulmonicola]|uniref:Uncharacterized protein n=1 Tax=Pandoraea pulmonicola TaxID=93221 RepID=A0AAJ4ZB29_PANPU|nr:hypothetical protein [Pandoraea pulmonicola]AJC21272.1 hypothetical protein RO07_13670 [Pandoraea pulmonicola]SUA90026.1 Uncharacterised protein [Pandoraea pulmonicola]